MTNHIPEQTTNSTDWLSIIKVLSSKQRLQTLFHLFVYQEISLTEFSSRFNQNKKNTTVYHMKLLVESGLIIEIDKPVEGSIKPAKFYRINPDFYQKMFIPFDNPDNLSKPEILEYSHQIFRWNALLFETMREFLNELREFNTNYEPKISDSEAAMEFHNKLHTPRDLIPLSEQGFQKYMKEYHTLIHNTQTFLSKEEEQEGTTIRPYLAFNMILPIKELLEFKKKNQH
jgi:DNA-binding transcriptional ArsR family regulator